MMLKDVPQGPLERQLHIGYSPAHNQEEDDAETSSHRVDAE